MKRIIIDGAFTDDIGRLHDMLAFSLDFPKWYGRNMDALYDCLTGELRGKATIVLRNEELIEKMDGGRGRILLNVLRDAADENRRLTVISE